MVALTLANGGTQEPCEKDFYKADGGCKGGGAAPGVWLWSEWEAPPR